MSFEEKLQAFARARSQEKKTDIERLLAEHAGKLQRASSLNPAPKPSSPALSLEELLPNCTRLENDFGSVLKSECKVAVSGNATHPRGYSFSPTPTRPLPDIQQFSDVLEFLSGDPTVREIPLEKWLFLDTESTGIAGASGTYPIIIGLGFFQACDFASASAPLESNPEYEFVCEQFFMEDYPQEGALLEHVQQRIRQFEGIVTFNGKTFDIPLLRGRYIVNRQRANLDLPHLDLLQITRRLFRARIQKCDLGTVERLVLKITREHDISGHLVPRIYFDYLRGLWPERLAPVFDHNAQDIISMGALLLMMVECIGDAEHPGIAQPEDLAALGRLCLRRGKVEEAAEYFERASLHSRDAALTNSALLDLARVYRKLGRAEDAAELWQRHLDACAYSDSRAVTELLKVLEHDLRNFERALEIMDRTEEHLQTNRTRSGIWLDAQFTADLAKRRNRIERRLQKAKKATG